ncbi:MAG: response regulator [Gammaproteobacteria bacterium]|nr:response regulator [Gammaproteobacteria bacterium]
MQVQNESLLKGLRFLVVDDFAAMRDMIFQMLKSLQVSEIDMVSDGKQAVSKMVLSHYDVVLCDYNLGHGKNGQQILEEARQRDLIRVSDIFVMITAESGADMVMGAIEHRPDDYISKPFNKELLKNRIERLILRKQNLAPIVREVTLGNIEKALEICDELIAANPKNILEVMRYKADMLMRERSYLQAIDAYEAINQRRPMPWARLGVAVGHFHTLHYEESYKILTALLSENPHYVECYDWLAQIEAKRDDYDRAIGLLQEAITISPFSVPRYRTLGEYQRKKGDLEGAEHSFTRVISLASESIHEDAGNNAKLAAVLIDKGESAKALKALSGLKKKYRMDPEGLLQISLSENRAHIARGSDQLAQQSIDEVDKLTHRITEPLSASTSLEVAKAYFSNGKDDEGVEKLKELVGNHHDDTDLLHNIEAVFDEHHLGEMGRELIATAKKEIVDLNNRGVTLAKQGKLNEAKTLFINALKSMPDNITINLNAAQIFVMALKDETNHNNYEDMEQLNRCINRVRILDPRNSKLAKLLTHLPKRK